MNIQWSPDPDAIERANHVSWDHPLGRLLRPTTYQAIIPVIVASVVLYGIAFVVLGAWPFVLADSGHEVLLSAAACGITALALTVYGVAVPPVAVMRSFPWVTAVGLAVATPAASWTVAHGGALGLAISSFYASTIVFGFYLLRLRPALVLVAFASGTLAWALQSLGLPLDDALLVWSTVTAAMTGVGVLMGTMAARLGHTATREQAARTSLATLAGDLEDQVQSQVQELEKLGSFCRFLAPQIADAVLSGGTEDVLKPHRRKISVFFCDLRGFTAFTAGAEPEDVVGLLDEYYASVGRVLRKHQATIGGYAGDGIMAFFGDPVESDAPASDAIEAAREVSEALDDLVATWEDRGVPVSYGIGLATGYATLGEVGFEDRVDYTALGTVVNLAARLCDKAEPGQVLMDHATSREASGSTGLTTVEGLMLKGMPADTKAYAL